MGYTSGTEAMARLLPQSIFDVVGMGPSTGAAPSSPSSASSFATASAAGTGSSTAWEQAKDWFSPADDDHLPCLPKLSRSQRAFGFVSCLVFGVLCFAMAIVYLPVIVMKARKFALLFSLGSLSVVA